jgi:hypothetical protein
MPSCPICEKVLSCPDAQDERHQQALDHAVQDCPLRKGAIYVQVLDDQGTGVSGITATAAGGSKPTDGSGFAYFDPLDENSYEAEIAGELPDSHKDTHVLPETAKVTAAVKAGEIKLVKFRLDKINIVTPKVEEEYKVALLDPGLATHQAGEPDTDRIYADPTYIEVSVTETNRAQHPFKTTAKLKCVPANVEVFLDEKCAHRLTEDLKAQEIADGKKLKLWLRGKTAGKFKVSVELADTGDRCIRPAKDVPELEMGVVEVVMEVHQHKISAIDALPPIDPDVDPIDTYYTNLKQTVLPAQEALTPEQKVKSGRLLHEQRDGNHGRAKLLIKKLVADQWPAGTDDYQLLINETNASGAVELYDAEFDGAAVSLPGGPLKVSDLKAADKELWAQGKTACTKSRGVRLDLTLDRAAGGLAKQPKRNGDWARFTVVKINEVKLDYTPVAGQANAWDATDKRYFINFKPDPDGRKITIGAQLSAEIQDVVVHFMLVEHKHNRKTANWGVDLPDGTRVLNASTVQDNAGTPQVFAANEPKWTWKDVAADVKHLDKEDRKKLLHVSEKTDAKGYAKKEVRLSRFGGDQFYLAAYIEQDPHLAKYIDGDTDPGNRKPPMMAEAIKVWRKFWYKEVKVAGLLVHGFGNAADTYQDVKAVMVPGTLVEMPRVDANAINPPVIYPKHMVSYYIDSGTNRYRNNYAGDVGDALVVGDANRSRFFALAAAEADKPVMYAMLNAQALWVAGGTVNGVPATDGPATHTWASTDDYQNSRVKIRFTQQLLDPPLQGGTLLHRGRWEAEDWVPHPLPTAGTATPPSGPNKPAGAPPGDWGNARSGDVKSGDIALDPNRSDPREVRVLQPADVVVGPHGARIRITSLHVRCAANFLGTSYADGIVNAFTLNDVQDFINTINHESGHSFQQVTATRPGNVPAHPLKYANQGNHCAYQSRSCVMYESGPIAGSLNRYCPVCHPYLLVADMSDVKGRLR